jgi:hypothetical protein
MCAIAGDHLIIAAIPIREQMMRVDKLLQSHALINMGEVEAKDLTWKTYFVYLVTARSFMSPL